jgi:hypothetical protein
VERSPSIIRVTRIGELGTTLALSSNRRTLSHLVFLRNVRRLLVTVNIPEDSIIHSHRRENLKSYIFLLFSVFSFWGIIWQVLISGHMQRERSQNCKVAITVLRYWLL